MAGPVRMDQIKSEAVQWLWNERVPRGMMTIVGGKPDQGKGLFCAHIAAEVSNAKFKMPNGKLRYGQVLYSAIEDSSKLMTKPRLVAAGANVKNVHDYRFRLPVMFEELTAYVKKHNIDLIIMDPLAAHLSHGISRHSDNIRVVLNPLSELLEETNCALVIVEHVLKRVPQSGHALGAIGGTGAGVVAAARMAFLFGSDPQDDERRILAPVKSNIREKPLALEFMLDVAEVNPIGDVPCLLYTGETDFNPMRLLQIDRGGKRGRPPDKREAVCEWLTNYLYDAGKPVLSGTVFENAKQYGWATMTVRRAKNDLNIVVNPPGGGPKVTWALPDKLRTMLDLATGKTVAPGEFTDDELEALFGAPSAEGVDDGS